MERARGGGGGQCRLCLAPSGRRAGLACPSQGMRRRDVVSTGLRMAMLASGQHAEVDTVAPDMARVSAAHEDVHRLYPPYHLTSAYEFH